jgi:heme exporter protein D
MYFQTWSAVWQMDGHGPYVWGAYSLTLVVIIVLIAAPLFRSRDLTRAIRNDEGRRALAADASGENHASKT